MPDRIELLGEELIEQNPALAMDVLGQSSRLALPLGWHYLLDLVWILKELGEQKNLTILELGAGTGLLQFILADLGHHVISADMRDRELPPHLQSMYRVESMGSADQIEHKYLQHHSLASRPSQVTLGKRLKNLIGKNSPPVVPPARHQPLITFTAAMQRR